MPEKIILTQIQSVGDWLVVTSAIESLHLQFPGRYITDYHCRSPELIANNPYITKLSPGEGRVIQMQNPSVHRSHVVGIHYLDTFCDYLGEQLGIPLKLQVSKPGIYLSENEKRLPKLENTWLINAGYKRDCQAKWWGTENYQNVVNNHKKAWFIQVGDGNGVHPRLKGENVIDMVNKTSIRELIRLASQCVGGIGGVTFLQHVFAGLDLPYVCLNLREPSWFTAYPRQTMLSTQGRMECNKHRACWACDVNEEKTGNNPCKLPMVTFKVPMTNVVDEAKPRCATMFDYKDVIKAMSSYNRNLHKIG
jgi:ADP-heptose:LPS heptosyltransferase